MKKPSLTFITSVAALLVLSVIVWQNYEKGRSPKLHEYIFNEPNDPNAPGLHSAPVITPITFIKDTVTPIYYSDVSEPGTYTVSELRYTDTATYGTAGNCDCNISINNDTDTAWLYNHSHILGQGD